MGYWTKVARFLRGAPNSPYVAMTPNQWRWLMWGAGGLLLGNLGPYLGLLVYLWWIE